MKWYNKRTLPKREGTHSENRFKKTFEKMKKVLDKPKNLWYYIQAVRKESGIKQASQEKIFQEN